MAALQSEFPDKTAAILGPPSHHSPPSLMPTQDSLDEHRRVSKPPDALRLMRMHPPAPWLCTYAAAAIGRAARHTAVRHHEVERVRLQSARLGVRLPQGPTVRAHSRFARVRMRVAVLHPSACSPPLRPPSPAPSTLPLPCVACGRALRSTSLVHQYSSVSFRTVLVATAGSQPIARGFRNSRIACCEFAGRLATEQARLKS